MRGQSEPQYASAARHWLRWVLLRDIPIHMRRRVDHRVATWSGSMRAGPSDIPMQQPIYGGGVHQRALSLRVQGAAASFQMDNPHHSTYICLQPAAGTKHGTAVIGITNLAPLDWFPSADHDRQRSSRRVWGILVHRRPIMAWVDLDPHAWAVTRALRLEIDSLQRADCIFGSTP